jgi:hypothetical protein
MMITCVSTPQKKVLEKLIIAHLLKKFPTSYETQKFITAFINAEIDGSSP